MDREKKSIGVSERRSGEEIDLSRLFKKWLERKLHHHKLVKDWPLSKNMILNNKGLSFHSSKG
jgi:hypothetical protein